MRLNSEVNLNVYYEKIIKSFVDAGEPFTQDL